MAKKRSRTGSKATRPEAEAACYFLSLSLRNVRCFGPEMQTLDLSDGRGRPARWTLLLGNNGTGKTTILQAVASFEHVSRVVSSAGTAAASTDDQTLNYPRAIRFNKSAFLRGGAEKATLAASLTYGTALSGQDGSPRAYQITCEMGPATMTRGPVPDEHKKGLKCYGYGASRRLGWTTLSPSEGDDATASLFSDDAPLRNAEEWLLRLDYSASKPSEIQGQQERRLRIVRELLIEILPEVEDIRFTAPTPEHRTPDVEFQTPYGWVGLSLLGHGYRTLIAWVVDFASRLFDRYPDSPDPLGAAAVALVDEIDLHLHPIWQRQLMAYLTECFPNTQFIVTAHSPLIVQAAAEEANIALLRREGDHVVIDNDVETVRGWRIDQLLTSDLFGLPSARPPQFDDLLERRKQLLTQAELTEEDRRELARIEEQVGPLPVGETAEAARAMALVEESIQLLQKEQRKAR